MHLGFHEVVAIALIDEDVPRLHAGGFQALDDLEHQLAAGVRQGVADGVHLDRDDVARFEERPPGLDGVIGAGQLFHPARHGLLDRLAILDPALDHPAVAGLDHAPGIGPRQAERTGLGRGPGRAGLRPRNVDGREDGQKLGRRQELPAMNPSAGIGERSAHGRGPPLSLVGMSRFRGSVTRTDALRMRKHLEPASRPPLKPPAGQCACSITTESATRFQSVPQIHGKGNYPRQRSWAVRGGRPRSASTTAACLHSGHPRR